jgi:hypothetical protein
MSQVDDDIVSNRSDNPTLIDVALSGITRRTILGAGSASAALAMTGGVAALLNAVPATAQNADRARRWSSSPRTTAARSARRHRRYRTTSVSSMTFVIEFPSQT